MISKLLGHSSAAVTARYLDHLTNGQAITALETAGLPLLQAVSASSTQTRTRPVNSVGKEGERIDMSTFHASLNL